VKAMSIVRQFPQFGGTFAKCRGAGGLLAANLASITLVLWTASRFYYSATFPFWVWSAALLVWTLFAYGVVVVAEASGERHCVVSGILTFGVCPLSIAACTRALSGNLNWAQAGAIGVVLAISLIVSRWLLAFAIGDRTLVFADGLRWALLQGVAVYAVHPYVRCAQVGLGDAYHYSITLADVVGQIRAGFFPIFIGQTQFAFNGGIHTLRTAPYFSHLGGLLDLVTLHTLPPYALCNVALLFSSVMGALGAYSAMLIFSPKRAWVALGLAALFVLSPAILTPLFENEMVATFMAVPMIPWLVLGVAMAVDNPNGWRPWLFQGAAIAGLWWAHPPTAIWATVLGIGTLLVVFVRRGVTRLGLARMSMAALLCALLAVYDLTSVLTLRLPPGPDTRASEAANIFGNIRTSWPATVEPLSAGGDHPLGDIQLGYGLLALAFAGLFVPDRRRSASVLTGCMLCILVLLVPLPGVTSWLWLHVPKAVLDVTNNWPMQRLYPILAGFAVFASLAGLSELKLDRQRWVAVLALAMSGALAWSAREAQILFASASRATFSPEKSELLFKPENITLTRVSYMFFGFFPNYFSNAPTQAFLETRLLDARTLAVIADGASSLPGSKAPRVATFEFRDAGDNRSQAKIRMEPRETGVFRFDFLGREPRGELQIEGRTLRRLYTLPSSGGEKAFGAGRQNGRVLAIDNDSDQPDQVEMRFVPDLSAGDWRGSSGPLARVTIERFESGGHAIELRSLLPFRALVDTDRKAILETPRVDVPGYRAAVNGLEVAIVRTGEGLVGVPVPAGTSDVRVYYQGPRVLRLAYGMSVATWLATGAFLLGFPIFGRSTGFSRCMANLDAAISRLIVPVLAAIAIGAALAILGTSLWKWAAAPASGNLRLVVRLPADNAGRVEPLLTTGRTGKGDVIYIKYLGGNRVSVGYDHWADGGPISAPIEVDFAQPQTIDISMKSLVRRSLWGGNPHAQPLGVHVKWNGNEAISTAVDSYPPGSTEVGANSIGASSCGPRFNGDILEIKAIEVEGKP
jgi:hypothetical protein